jgi:hypothetical protein
LAAGEQEDAVSLDDLEGSIFRVCEHPDRLADAESQARAEEANVLRARWGDPDYERLRREGFVVRPDWIMWVREVPAGTDSLLAAQSKTQRSRTRLAMRTLAAHQMSVQDPVTAEPYDEWLQMYAKQIAAMPNGVDVASHMRDDVLALGSQHLLATWRDDRGTLVCGMVARRDHEYGLLHVRFLAVCSPQPAPELPRAMYAEMAALTRSYGLSTLSMGIDMNFYGAVLKPGLCLYKLRLGAVPVPVSVLGDPDSGLVADKMLGLRGLAQPVLCFEQLPAAAFPPAPGGYLAAAARQLRLVGFVSDDFDQNSVPELGRMQVRLVA